MSYILQNPKPITEQQFQILPDLDGWTIYEIPQPYWGQMTFLPRMDELVGVYASGCQLTSDALQSNLYTAGVDVIAHESRPMQNSRYGPEPQINIYHMLFQKLKQSQGGFSYLCYGPFNFGALQEHWPKSPDAAIQFYSEFDKHINW